MILSCLFNVFLSFFAYAFFLLFSLSSSVCLTFAYSWSFLKPLEHFMSSYFSHYISLPVSFISSLRLYSHYAVFFFQITFPNCKIIAHFSPYRSKRTPQTTPTRFTPHDLQLLHHLAAPFLLSPRYPPNLLVFHFFFLYALLLLHAPCPLTGYPPNASPYPPYILPFRHF